MKDFDRLLQAALPGLERFVKFRISSRFDAEDVIQEVCARAYQRQSQLKNPEAFQGWVLAIARSQCADYYRKQTQRSEVSLDALPDAAAPALPEQEQRWDVAQALQGLSPRERELLHLYYFREWPQQRIAAYLGVPAGTVKSRLYYARKSFQRSLSQPPPWKGENNMKQLPDWMPDYTIAPSSLPPFPVRWEEMMGWFIVPRLGEKLTWAMYDFPEKKKTEECAMRVVGPAEVHGIQGVEIHAVETNPMDCNSPDGSQRVERRFIAQLTDRYCRILAESHLENGVKKCYTFLDGAPFLNSWGFGPDNCGNAVALSPQGDIRRNGQEIVTAQKEFLLDVVGRYTVKLGGREYDTVCVMDCETYNEGVVSEQYLDRQGRTVLWRRFNRNDWRQAAYGKPWTELLPDNERILVNGIPHVHWYDCLTDYVL